MKTGAMNVHDSARAMTYDELLDGYRRMVILRRFDEEALRLRLAGEIHGPVHPYTGQEAIAVGITAALAPEDTVLSNHRGHGHCLAKGAAADRMMAELFGRSTGYCAGKGGSMHVTDVSSGVLGADGIVGANTAMAVGVALNSTLTDSHTVCVCFFGDGATGQGLLYESMNLASLWRLPVVFVCENNGWAADTPSTVALAPRSITQVADVFGLSTVVADGNDILDVYEKASPLIRAARDDSRPGLIECITYRRGVHAQRAAPVVDKRPAVPAADGLSKDPLDTALRQLARYPSGAADAMRARQDADSVIQEAIEFARQSPWPDPSTALQDVWSDAIETGF